MATVTDGMTPLEKAEWLKDYARNPGEDVYALIACAVTIEEQQKEIEKLKGQLKAQVDETRDQMRRGDKWVKRVEELVGAVYVARDALNEVLE